MAKPKLAIAVSSSSSPQLRLHSFSARDSRGVLASSPVIVASAIAAASAGTRRGVGTAIAAGDELDIGNPAPRIAQLRLAQEITADRRRHRRAAARRFAAMLDDDGADIARRDGRREGDEESVIALLPRHVLDLAQPVIALGLRDVADLRGARLAAHLEPGLADARAIGGAALLVDDGAHPVEDEAEVLLTHARA